MREILNTMIPLNTIIIRNLYTFKIKYQQLYLDHWILERDIFHTLKTRIPDIIVFRNHKNKIAIDGLTKSQSYNRQRDIKKRYQLFY